MKTDQRGKREDGKTGKRESGRTGNSAACPGSAGILPASFAAHDRTRRRQDAGAPSGSQQAGVRRSAVWTAFVPPSRGVFRMAVALLAALLAGLVGRAPAAEIRTALTIEPNGSCTLHTDTTQPR